MSSYHSDVMPKTEPRPDILELSTHLRRRADATPRPQKTAALIAQSIVAKISSLGLKPGDMLPPEREMLAEYSVGRGTLREALRFLEMQGVITIRPGPGGGPTVSTPDSRYLAGTLSIALQFARTPFRSIIEARTVIDPAVAAAAAERASDEMIREFGESVERMETNLDSLEIFIEENSHFYDLIAWASSNPVFGYLLSSLHVIDEGTAITVQFPAWTRKVTAKAHRKIYEAIRKHDGEAARSAMADHSIAYQKFLEENYTDLLDQRIRWADLT
jgi:GntR family transcriptional regulator, transcriptional repressor for pyruvate dehydrogenase complex